MTDDPANADMVEGYMDGFNPDTPEPSANRSESYRHGFMVGRADRAGSPAFGGADAARAHAATAMNNDRLRYGA